MASYRGQTGISYELSPSRLAKGGEGEIYRVVGHGKKVAKIYTGTPSSDLEEKLLLMVKFRDQVLKNLSSVAWPLDVIYDANKRFCGFIMPELGINAELGAIYKYSSPQSSGITNQQKIHIARNICVVIAAVHNTGCVFGDFNPRNIGVDKNTGLVSFLDTDSYHVYNRPKDKTYRCVVGCSGYIAPELLEKSHKHTRANPNDAKQTYAKMSLPTFTQESDNFALAIHIFKLLMNGFTPYGGIPETSCASTASPGRGDDAVRRDSYCFKPGNKPLDASPIPRIETFPKEIQDLFARAFIAGRRDPRQRPSANDWHGALGRYEQSLVACRDNSLHQYDRKNSVCPYCEADKRYQNVVAPPTDNKGNLTQEPYKPPLSPPSLPPSLPLLAATTILGGELGCITGLFADVWLALGHPVVIAQYNDAILGVAIIVALIGAFFGKGNPIGGCLGGCLCGCIGGFALLFLFAGACYLAATYLGIFCVIAAVAGMLAGLGIGSNTPAKISLPAVTIMACLALPFVIFGITDVFLTDGTGVVSEGTNDGKVKEPIINTSVVIGLSGINDFINSLANDKNAGQRDVLTIQGIDYAFRWCPAGTFMMGSPENEKGRGNDEKQHQVTLTKGFWMLETKVTNEMWASVMGSSPRSSDWNKKHPVTTISWYDCQRFIDKLNESSAVKSTKLRFSLPTESQWEYACRAGSTGALGGNGHHEEMCLFHDRKSVPDSYEVGQKKPNAWGFYDMTSGIYDWCGDWYGNYPSGSVTDPIGHSLGSRRVGRGSGTVNDLSGCRSAIRFNNSPSDKAPHWGFRIVLVNTGAGGMSGDTRSITRPSSFDVGEQSASVPSTSTSRREPSSNTKPAEVDLIAFVKETNFLEVCLPKHNKAWESEAIQSMTVGEAFAAVPQFRQQKWGIQPGTGRRQTIALEFVIINNNGTRNQAKILFTLDITPNTTARISMPPVIMFGGAPIKKTNEDFFKAMCDEMKNMYSPMWRSQVGTAKPQGLAAAR